MAPREKLRFPVELHYDGRNPLDQRGIAALLRELAARVEAGDAETLHAGWGVEYADDELRILGGRDVAVMMPTPDTLNVAILVRLYPGIVEHRPELRFPAPADGWPR